MAVTVITLKGARIAAAPDKGDSAGRDICQRAGFEYSASLQMYTAHIDRLHRLAELAGVSHITLVPDPNLIDVVSRRIAELRESDATLTQRLAAKTPYPYQVRGARYLIANTAACLADDMGLGKTVQVSLALPPDRPVIVVCPAFLRRNWLAELRRWSSLTPVIVDELISAPGIVSIISYGRLAISSIRKDEIDPGTILVGDEIHACKKASTKRTKAFRQLASYCDTVWGLTGTPLENRPNELWGVLQTLNLARATFEAFPIFRYLYQCKNVKAFSGGWGAPLPEVATKLSRTVLRRTRASVLPDLPVKTWKYHETDLNTEAADLCDTFLAEFGIDFIDEMKTSRAFHDGTSEGMAALSRARKALAKCKTPALHQLLDQYEENATPVVVFSAHREPILSCAKRAGWGIITGQVSEKTRHQVVSDFQAGKLKGVAATIAAGGEGLTLTRAHHVVFVDRAWNPAKNSQAEDRVCRIGQTRGVIVTDLVAPHPVDEALEAKLSEKAVMIQGTLADMTEIESPIEDRITELETILAFLKKG